jgi:hypothetical protein
MPRIFIPLGRLLAQPPPALGFHQAYEDMVDAIRISLR